MTSQSQLTANQLNALKSTGPCSAEGKDVSRFNALKHGIDARSLAIPGEDPDELAALINDYLHQFRPDGPVEQMMVDTLIRADWHLRRYDRIESGLIARMLGDAGPNAALADLFGSAAPKSNPLPHLFRRRQAAQRDYFRALKELQRKQKERRQNEEADDSQAQPAPIGFDPHNRPATVPPASEPPAPPMKIAS
jgi:hypothetical protein